MEKNALKDIIESFEHFGPFYFVKKKINIFYIIIIFVSKFCHNNIKNMYLFLRNKKDQNAQKIQLYLLEQFFP